MNLTHGLLFSDRKPRTSTM